MVFELNVIENWCGMKPLSTCCDRILLAPSIAHYYPPTFRRRDYSNIVTGMVHASVPNWFLNGNMGTKSQIKTSLVCMCILWISRSSLIMMIFRRFLPELCPFLYIKFANFLVSRWYPWMKSQNEGNKVYLSLTIHFCMWKY
jgi:hypothetical protein